MRKCPCGRIANQIKIGSWVCNRCHAIEQKLYTDLKFNFQIFAANWVDNPKLFRKKEDILRLKAS